MAILIPGWIVKIVMVIVGVLMAVSSYGFMAITAFTTTRKGAVAGYTIAALSFFGGISLAVWGIVS